ncbi:MAG: hypothetical protein A2Y62_14615 [Candidatus Fischerbacteria bacterium RBG_13_37_8]|uniref:DUF4145 domain-containing protein n=1 Tax=Candidatus Fischerbacteria bacterium RBG_13_37_8 TaxID=1817863 RepID=A0A1F5VMT4_9BACT|nr:MAG: hypothetical protein A2Y62_14615 [Candidatus Fischerbacteria bacterium RBG_13_37_8]
MQRFYNEKVSNWFHLQNLPAKSFVCGFCNVYVSSVKGYKLGKQEDGIGEQIGAIYICASCGAPIFIAPDNIFYPSPSFGKDVDHVPEKLYALYQESRKCSSRNCYTASVLICRKMLLNIAVAKGAKEGLTFKECVDYLNDKGYIPPDGKLWGDYIRTRGNEANHEISLMTEEDAKNLILFAGMLLSFIYQLPGMLLIKS